MLTLLALLAAPVPASCAYDRAAMLALDEDTFDQDMTGGWRRLSDAGCDAAAADLIRDWRAVHPEAKRRWLSFWHEGQVRALAGQTRQAIALFGQSYRPTAADRHGWNAYVAGSIAFLRRDRRGLAAARAQLLALPKPADWDAADKWPMNLEVLDGFHRCRGLSYKAAYPCKRPMMKATVPVPSRK